MQHCLLRSTNRTYLAGLLLQRHAGWKTVAGCTEITRCRRFSCSQSCNTISEYEIFGETIVCSPLTWLATMKCKIFGKFSTRGPEPCKWLAHSQHTNCLRHRNLVCSNIYTPVRVPYVVVFSFTHKYDRWRSVTRYPSHSVCFMMNTNNANNKLIHWATNIFYVHFYIQLSKVNTCEIHKYL